MARSRAASHSVQYCNNRVINIHPDATAVDNATVAATATATTIAAAAAAAAIALQSDGVKLKCLRDHHLHFCSSPFTRG